MNMERIVQPGEFYRHFKNKLYQIITVAVHSETNEPMVVYQALYGDYQIYVRPYEMFVGEVDHVKYPDAAQKYRFERVVPGGDGGFADCTEEALLGDGLFAAQKQTESRTPNPYFLEFLDAETYEKQMECLKYLAGTATQSELDSIYLVLDMKAQEGSIQEQTEAIGNYLSMQHHFDGSRLR